MTSSELREKFLEFFRERGHKVIPSASLVPENDPSVLFTTAGMQQFKRYYLFPDEAPAARVATIQKCLRTGDIDEIGDESHLTFFEMLGNFSFGYPDKDESYFKEEAIAYAWEFLTEVLKIDKSHIHASYFKGEKGIPEDTLSHEILQRLDGLKRIEPQDFKENFWSLGTEGSPGGPTVEFYVDGVEVWNLVLNEFVLRSGKYVESEFKGVDTGMGLERLTAVMQGKSDVYKTDLFEPFIKKIEEISDKRYANNKKEFRIITDHLRSATNLILEGVTPGKNDREYILRVLLRVIFIQINHILSAGEEASDITGALHNMFIDHSDVIEQIFDPKIFEVVIKEYRTYLSLEIKGMSYVNRHIHEGMVTGEDIFEGRDTFGLSKEGIVDLWKVAKKEISSNWKDEYDAAFQKHRELSRTASAGMFKGGLADNKVETARLHTAAHLLLAALRQVLSPDINQKGSNITEERLRFDFNWPEKLTPEQINEVEKIVNEKIKENIPVEMEELSLEDAKKSGATGVFDDRYGEKVKIYSIGSFSREICGGPHVKSTSELGNFKIIKEESSSAGIRRIKAILEQF